MLQNDMKKLLAWYQAEKRDLPWRLTREPYAVAVSELMLQQTTVAAVIPKYEMWMDRFPNVAALALASVEDVMAAWSGLGYYQRARRLQQAAAAVVSLGSFPSTYEDLLELPGFGPYTAAAVASICFERPTLAVDTNVIRVLYRYYEMSRTPQDKAAHSFLRDKMKSSLEWADPGELNQALMELGASRCSIASPGCLLCPLRAGCAGRKSVGGPEKFPLPKVKKPIKKTPGQVFLLESGEGILLVKGTSLGLLGDLYQPPMLFRDQKESEPVSHLTAWLAGMLESSVTSTEGWSLSYGISGRKLQLEGCSWKLEPEEVKRVKAHLETSLLPHRWVDYAELKAGSEQPAPLSTLTRRVLKKWWESV